MNTKQCLQASDLAVSQNNRQLSPKFLPENLTGYPRKSMPIVRLSVCDGRPFSEVSVGVPAPFDVQDECVLLLCGGYFHLCCIITDTYTMPSLPFYLGIIFSLIVETSDGRMRL